MVFTGLPKRQIWVALRKSCTSYFEMIAKYENGYAKTRRSEEHFRLGVYSVFPELRNFQASANVPGVQGNVVSIVDCVLDVLYEGLRCGLYHS